MGCGSSQRAGIIDEKNIKEYTFDLSKRTSTLIYKTQVEVRESRKFWTFSLEILYNTVRQGIFPSKHINIKEKDHPNSKEEFTLNPGEHITKIEYWYEENILKTQKVVYKIEFITSWKRRFKISRNEKLYRNKKLCINRLSGGEGYRICKFRLIYSVTHGIQNIESEYTRWGTEEHIFKWDNIQIQEYKGCINDMSESEIKLDHRFRSLSYKNSNSEEGIPQGALPEHAELYEVDRFKYRTSEVIRKIRSIRGYWTKGDNGRVLGLGVVYDLESGRNDDNIWDGGDYYIYDIQLYNMGDIIHSQQDLGHWEYIYKVLIIRDSLPYSARIISLQFHTTEGRQFTFGDTHTNYQNSYQVVLESHADRNEELIPVIYDISWGFGTDIQMFAAYFTYITRPPWVEIRLKGGKSVWRKGDRSQGLFSKWLEGIDGMFQGGHHNLIILQEFNEYEFNIFVDILNKLPLPRYPPRMSIEKKRIAILKVYLIIKTSAMVEKLEILENLNQIKSTLIESVENEEEIKSKQNYNAFFPEDWVIAKLVEYKRNYLSLNDSIFSKMDWKKQYITEDENYIRNRNNSTKLLINGYRSFNFDYYYTGFEYLLKHQSISSIKISNYYYYYYY